MAGIIILLILGAWFFICKRLSSLFVTHIENERIKIASKWVLFVVLLTTPVMDEIIGGFQFRALCEQGNKLIYEDSEVRGKTLIWAGLPREAVSGTILSISEVVITLVEPTTNEVQIQFKKYYASGGWLSRLVGYDTARPYIFDGVCGAKEDISKLRSELNIKTKFVK